MHQRPHRITTALDLIGQPHHAEVFSVAVGVVSIRISIHMLAIIIGFILLGISVVLVWSGLRNYRRGTAIAGAKPLDGNPSSGGLRVVEGIVEEAVDGHSLESRYGGAPCVAYAAKKVTQESYGKESIKRLSPGNYRERISKKTGAIPFTMDTGQDSVRVDTSDAYVDVSEEEYSSVSLQQIRENRGIVHALFHLVITLLYSTDRRKRRDYREARFLPGNRVRVIGAVSSSGGGSGVSIGPGAGAPLVVAKKSQAAIADGFLTKGKARAFWSVLLFAIGLVVLLTVTGHL